jgi:ADP-glucose pyrophosphorylase
MASAEVRFLKAPFNRLGAVFDGGFRWSLQDIDGHLVAIFGADHVYRMNIREMIEFHMQRRAEVSVAAIPIAVDLSAEFGVIEASPNVTILGFHEKKAQAPTMPGEPHPRRIIG